MKLWFKYKNNRNELYGLFLIIIVNISYVRQKIAIPL